MRIQQRGACFGNVLQSSSELIHCGAQFFFWRNLSFNASECDLCEMRPNVAKPSQEVMLGGHESMHLISKVLEEVEFF